MMPSHPKKVPISPYFAYQVLGTRCIHPNAVTGNGHKRGFFLQKNSILIFVFFFLFFLKLSYLRNGWWYMSQVLDKKFVCLVTNGHSTGINFKVFPNATHFYIIVTRLISDVLCSHKMTKIKILS